MSFRSSFLTGVLLLAAAPAWAAGQPPTTPPQQQAKTCNIEASTRGLSGEALDSFVSRCQKVGAAAATAGIAPSKEQYCTVQANNQHLSGAGRSSFMAKCTGR